MGTAVNCVDVVGEAEDVLGVGVVVLEGYLDGGGALSALHVDRACAQRLLVAVEMADEGDEATLKIERAFSIRTLIDQPNPQALVQVGRLAQALGDRVERQIEGFEDLWIRPEAGCRAAATSLRPDLAHRRRGHAP